MFQSFINKFKDLLEEQGGGGLMHLHLLTLKKAQPLQG